MVPRSSAVCSISKESNRMEICADHYRMVKFQSRSDVHYQRVIVKIQEMMKTYETRDVQERLQGGSSESSECASD
jgi:hypothetical protein